MELGHALHHLAKASTKPNGEVTDERVKQDVGACPEISHSAEPSSKRCRILDHPCFVTSLPHVQHESYSANFHFAHCC